MNPDLPDSLAILFPTIASRGLKAECVPDVLVAYSNALSTAVRGTSYINRSIEAYAVILSEQAYAGDTGPHLFLQGVVEALRKRPQERPDALYALYRASLDMPGCWLSYPENLLGA